MIWNTIADTNIVRVRVNFDNFGVFLQENPTIEVLSKSNAAVLLIIGDDTFGYVPDENKMVYINMYMETLILCLMLLKCCVM